MVSALFQIKEIELYLLLLRNLLDYTYFLPTILSGNNSQLYKSYTNARL